jgi:hypothetical protein
MSILTRIKKLMALPRVERNARIKRGLQDRTSIYLYERLGNWVNRGRTRFMVDYRPDSHVDFDRNPDYDALFEGW